MECNIELKEASYVTVEGLPILITGKGDRTLTLVFKSKYNLQNAFIRLANGSLETLTRLKRDGAKRLCYAVPEEYIHAGSLDVVITIRNGATVLKKWTIEPITISEETDEFKLSSYVTELEKKVGELEKRVSALEEKNSNLFSV